MFFPPKPPPLFLSGQRPVPRALLQRVMAVADESFTRTVTLTVEDLPELPEGWRYALDTAIALKLKGYCEPHRDDFMGAGEAQAHASLFWLFRDTSKRPSKLMVEDQATDVSPGTWVAFEDSKLHAFLAEGTWAGVAIQFYR
jgi:hypothetical protein